MINLVCQFYEAIHNHDETTLQKILHPTMFGMRLFDGTLLKSKEDVLSYFKHHTISYIDLQEETQIGSTMHYTYKLHTKKIKGKIVIVDQAIYRIYEIEDTGKIRVMIRCSYDGSRFEGFQKQPNKRTIQGTIESAIQAALKLNEPIKIHASGRTDKGVHAYNQYFHFDIENTIPVERYASIIQNKLPKDILLLESYVVPLTHHSRYDVTKKTYKYILNTGSFDITQRNYQWTIGQIDVKRFKEVALQLVGTHDFTSFTTTSEKDTIRTIYQVNVNQRENKVVVSFTGNGFLRYMVRYMVATIVLITRNELQIDIYTLLKAKNNSLLNELAPPGGLYLSDVSYD
jgi:tRNA pseudouridine38-40 synthase